MMQKAHKQEQRLETLILVQGKPLKVVDISSTQMASYQMMEV